MKDVRTFWSAQADAVAAKPFTCPALLDMNDQFAKIRLPDSDAELFERRGEVNLFRDHRF